MHFAPELTALTRVDAIQRALRDEFPLVFLPRDRKDSVQLRSRAEDLILTIAINRVSLITTNYPGNESFRATAVSLIPRVLDLLDPQVMFGALYRYDNEIELNGAPIEDVIAEPLPSWCCGGSHTQHLDLEWRKGWEHGHVGGEMYIEADKLFVEIFGTASFHDNQQFAAILKLAHDKAYACFEAMITEAFRSRISRPI